MTSDEPYRWLEAIANRREYIRDQLKGATPVFALSRPEGILLFGVGSGQSKVFEIYDRHALGVLGHPVDIEKVRQTVIEAAHMEGFTRAPEDVTVRRLLNFSLGTALKFSFEQIFSAPLIVECILAEVGATPELDVLARVNFDGAHHFSARGVVVAHTNAGDEAAAADWLRAQLSPSLTLAQVARVTLRAWRALTAEGAFKPPLDTADAEGALAIDGRTLEWALLDRRITAGSRYRALTPTELL